MYMNMEMRHFLKRRLTDGVPQTQALVGERDSDRTRNAYNRPHERRTSCMIELADVMQVSTRHDQGVAWMKLPQVKRREPGRLAERSPQGPTPAQSHKKRIRQSRAILANLTMRLSDARLRWT
jgi:hypothetical protein